MAWDKLSPVKTVGMATSVPSSQASPALVNALFERVEEQAEVRTFTIIKKIMITIIIMVIIIQGGPHLD